MKWSPRPYDEPLADTWRASIKIHPAGDVMECVMYQGTAYSEINPEDPRYTMRYRQ
jgi:hypothetical protein